MSKTVLITGVSSGFGHLTVPLLLARGHTVIAGVRGGEERLKSVFDAEHLATGRLLGLDMHMDRKETFGAAVELIDERFGGRLDALVNNAGYGSLGPCEDHSEDAFRQQMEVNYFGLVELTRALLPALREARGRIINISSLAGLITMPFYGVYSASKHALEAYSESLYYELKPFGVQVGLIEPGGFATKFTSTATQGLVPVPGTRYLQWIESNNRFLEKFGDKTANPMIVARLIARSVDRRRLPLRRLVGLDAHAVSFLARFIPDRLRVWLTDQVFRRIVFRM